MVAFRITGALGGLADCHGVLRAEAEGLHLEFQTRDGFIGVLRSEVRSVVILWEDVAELEYRTGWFSASLHLVTRSLKSLNDVPGAKGCRVLLKLARADRAAAQELASFARLRLYEHDLRRMQSDVARQATRE